MGNDDSTSPTLVTPMANDATAAEAPGAKTALSANAADAPTVLAGRYRITGLLGSGSMGTVYRALDLELDETVALKLLKKDRHGDPNVLARFVREVKLARRVTHRNVVRTFDIGEHLGDRFLTMEYIEGTPLSALLTSGPLSVERVCAIAVEICGGLEASHAAGVVHADLKPSNVICATDGRIAVTDFGISRAISIDVQPGLKDPDAGAGTVGYMSPEQVEALPSIDGRADIYALGCILFRMITGALPWRGTSLLSSAALRLSHPPPDPRELVPNLPSSLVDTIGRCMARNRDDRFASAGEVADALRATPRSLPFLPRDEAPQPSSRGGARTIAVLPPHNRGAADDDYLAYGFAEELVDALSRLPRTRVRPLAAAALEATRGADPREVGRALSVDAIVEGSLVRRGDRFELALRLVTVRDGFQVWARRTELHSTAILDVAAETAAEIARVVDSDAPHRGQQCSADPVAQDAYLRGRYLFVTGYYDVADAIPLLRMAYERAGNDVRIASTYTLALIRHFRFAELGSGVASLVKTVAERAFASHPDTAEANIALGAVCFEHGEYRSSAIALCRALSLAPSHPDALDWSGRMLLEAGEPEWALDHFMRAKAADPNNIAIDAGLVRAHFASGDEETAWRLARAPTLSSEASPLHWNLLGRLAIWTRNREAAARELARLRLLGASRATRRSEQILSAAAGGELDGDMFDAVLQGARRSGVPRRDAFISQVTIEMLLATNMVDRAREELACLDDQSFFDLTWLDRCPVLDPLRGGPELSKLRASTLARAGAALEIFERTRVLFDQRRSA